ncbi:MAG: prepilin-type N-terminal cleavage/methylation domain-containing protein [Planctomycetaceae bacterium]|nr:prepilin-type N-terminal cleavage/methylation domain-containing protein [Planctomycetaceae bacterium]
MKKNGFTLIELLVVLAVIVALVAILVPSLGKARQIAYKIYCLNNLKQLGIAVNLYTQQYKVYPVCVNDVNVTWEQFVANPEIGNKKMLGVPAGLWPYHKEKKLYECPMLLRKAAQVSYCYDSRAGREIPAGQTAYAALKPLFNPPGETTTTDKKDYYLLTPDRVKSPKAFVILYDLPLVDSPVSNAAGLYQNIDPDDANSFNDDVADSNGYLWNYNDEPAEGPHSKGFNILFADMHVKWFKTWNQTEMTRKAD